MICVLSYIVFQRLYLSSSGRDLSAILAFGLKPQNFSAVEDCIARHDPKDNWQIRITFA